MNPEDQIRKLRPGSDPLIFPETKPYVAMRVTSLPTSMDKPSKAQKEKCEEVILKFDANTLANCGISTYAETGTRGEPDPKRDVRLDNESIEKVGDKCFAKMRIQANDRSKRSPTFAVLMAETSPEPDKEGPFFGVDRLRAALSASVHHGVVVKFEKA